MFRSYNCTHTIRRAFCLTRISQLAYRMVQMGLLGRGRLTNDRRVAMLRLTRGEELVQWLDALVQEFYVQEFYEALTEGVSEAELAAFLSASQRMVHNYDAMQRTGPQQDRSSIESVPV